MNSRTRTILIVNFAIDALLLAIFVPHFLFTRPLSEDERAILLPVFEQSVDLEAVRIKSGGPLTLVYPGITLGNTIAFPKGRFDLAVSDDQALLVHEVVHVWQYQHFGLSYIPRSLFELISQRDTYVVHHDSEKDFLDYDIEEQAEIVAEYYLTSPEIYQPYIETLREQR
ncbi:DUF4157 domain-containing protein [Patescibacteria group bacterium]|nr:DUF4157 domain-containing protein [Patescibacteria group bacterium]